MAEKVSPYLKFDVQRNNYYEGENDFLNKELETEDEKYKFQFERLYTYHEGAIRAYKFKAKLKDEVVRAEKELDPKFEIIAESEIKVPAFKWIDLNSEVWHIDTVQTDYDKMMETLWINYLELNDEEDIIENRNKGVKYWEALNIGAFRLPEDWTGKDKVYFIKDGGIKITPEDLDNYGSIYSDNEQENYDNYINEAICTIRDAIEVCGAGTASEAGIDVENYGFS